jgi:capsular exopolysaccharide synthesis family protein
MANYKSIVIDLDLHKPELHKYFDIEHTKGVSTYLSGKDNIGDIIFSTAHQNLDIITAGPIAPNPSDLILSERLEILLNTLKKRYDYVFIDSAPFSMVADTLYLMQHANINLVVLREKVSKKSSISNLENMIKQHDFNNVGLLINS